MPFASAGSVITDSAQILTGVVNSGDIANGAIVNEDVNAAAGIVIGKLSGVAALGANADITSLAGLTTPLSVGQGGSGASSLDDHFVLIGSGAGAVTPITPDTAGKVLISNGVAADPSFQTLAESWQLGGRTVLGGAGTSLSVGSLPARQFYKVFVNIPGTVTADHKLKLNSDAGNNYSYKASTDRAAAAGANQGAAFKIADANAAGSARYEITIGAATGKQKNIFSVAIGQPAAGEGPVLTESWGTWLNTANAITTIEIYSASNLPAGSVMDVYVSAN